MKLTLEITMDNAAFEDDPQELSRILSKLAEQADHDPHTRPVFDINGNTVGRFTITNQ